jgi:hypothetical protein
VVYWDGRTERYQHGELHDGPNGEPAIISADGAVERYRYGVRISWK